MLTFHEFIVEFVLGQPMIARGLKGSEHTKKYLSNPSDTFVTAAKVGHIGKDERVKLHGTRYDQASDTHYATISHASEPERKIEVPINKIRKPPERRTKKGGREAESTATTDLHNQIVEHNKTKPLMMYDRFGTKHHIVGAVQIKGNPKADIALVNDKGEHVIHISHKKSEESHQGFGALNSKSNVKHPVVSEFANKLTKTVPNELMSLKGKSRTMPLQHNNPTHTDLIKKSLFGSNHDGDKSGPENVDVICHGKINLKTNNRGVSSINSEKDIDRKNYRDQKYEIVAKHATDRTVPGTKIGAIIGVNVAGARKGRDVKSLDSEEK
jgi:hypothetical protein